MKINESKTVIGLTGGLGTGKSTVGHLFEELGAFVVDADRIAHETLSEGNEVFSKIAERFPEAVAADGTHIDRTELAAIIFASSVRRGELEGLVHPYVLERLIEETTDAEQDTVVLEVPLLFEAGLDRYCDQSIVVTAPDEAADERLREKGVADADIRLRRSAQMPLQRKIEKADFIIDNSKDIKETKRAVAQAWQSIHRRSKGAV